MPSKSFIKLIFLLLFLSIGPASIAFLYTRTGGLESRREIHFHKTLRYIFMSNVESVELQTLTDWPWETVCIFNSNTSEKQVNSLIGFNYENYSQLTWVNLSDHWTFLFIDRIRETNWGMHRPVIAIRVPFYEIARYGGPKGGKCVRSEDANLLIRRGGFSKDSSPIFATISEK